MAFVETDDYSAWMSYGKPQTSPVISEKQNRAAEIEWLQSLLDHIEKGEIELVKESIGGAIEILGRK